VERELEAVRRSAEALAKAQAKFEAAVREAASKNFSLRAIAAQTHVSYETIRAVLKR